jgi:hypothetical protein
MAATGGGGASLLWLAEQATLGLRGRYGRSMLW